MPSPALSRLPAILALCAALAAPAARADIELHYPLAGYFHPGRYMPVRVVADLPEIGALKDQSLYLSTPGAMETELVLGGGKANAVVPWLALDEVDGPMTLKVLAKGFAGRQQEDSQRLRPLRSDQLLVAYATGDAASAVAAAARAADVDAAPGRRSGAAWVAVELDRSQPLDGPPAAWEGVDAVVLDLAAVESGQVDEEKLGALVAGGAAVLVRDPNPAAGADKPVFFPHWPWRRVNVGGTAAPAASYWLLHQTPAGPGSLTYSDRVFRPVLGKNDGWPAPFRKRVVLYGVLFSVTLLALALWRPRGVVVLAMILSAGTVGLLAAWWRLQTPIVGQGGPIIVTDGKAEGGLIQTNGTSFQSTATPAASTLRWADVTKPVFARREDLETGNLVLRCGPAGDPHEFFVRLPADGRLALWTRSVGPGTLTREPTKPATSELMPLVDEFYLGRGDEVLGQIPWTPPVGPVWQQPQAWPAVVIRRAK